MPGNGGFAMKNRVHKSGSTQEKVSTPVDYFSDRNTQSINRLVLSAFGMANAM